MSNILFILEGEKTEIEIVNNLKKLFFSSNKINLKIISISAKQNIYMLYEKIKSYSIDGMFPDLIEVLKEFDLSINNQLTGYTSDSFSEIYLFFDFDYQQSNLGKRQNVSETMLKMLDFFDNETENGKLYISYPMVEALKDCREMINIYEVVDYKQTCHEQNIKYSNINKFDFTVWKVFFNNFRNVLNILYNISKLDFEFYNKNINPTSVFKKEIYSVKENGEIYILSGFLEFLLDYNKKSFWVSVFK